MSVFITCSLYLDFRAVFANVSAQQSNPVDVKTGGRLQVEAMKEIALHTKSFLELF